MSNENNLTYIFQNKETKEIMWFMPIAKLLKFLSAKELGFDLYNASGNTCQINVMLSKVIKKNKFLANIFPKFTNISISEIHRILTNSSAKSRDGWKDKTNPVSIIKWFNNNLSNNSTEYNRELALSCSGVKDFDMIGVIYNDFLSKYFDKASDNGKNHMDCLYYRNFNIEEEGKLVTGMSNFKTETFRSELLKKYCFLDIDMCVYDFSNYQYRDQIKALFKLIMENVFVHDNKEYNLYTIANDEFVQHRTKIKQQVSDMLKGYYQENYFHVSYDFETRRFLMNDEKGKLHDATAYLYITLCDSLKQKKLAKSKGKLRDFVESRTNSDIIDKVTADHYQEKCNLIKNIAEYFGSDLLDSALKTIEFTEKEKTEMKKYFFDKSPLEFFFKKPDEIKNKLNEDKNCNVGQNPDKENSITRYILAKNIDELLTEQGKEFLDMVKKIASSNEYFNDRIKKDEIDKIFEQYQSQNGVNCTYKNNTQNKKTKIEFSVLKALIESIDSGSNVAYQNFFVQLSYYLNYFFCNEKKLSKNELRNSIKKEIDEINKKISDINQKQDAREKEVGNMAKDNLSDDKYQSKLEEINKAYGNKMGLILQLSKAQDENKNFKKTIFFRQEVKLSLEAFDDNDQATGLNKFEKYFLGYDEKTFGIVQPKIKSFVQANELFKDKSIEAAEDDKRVDIKTNHLIDAVKNYLGGTTSKITFDWFNLYVNYVCQHAKMECEKIMDGVVNQNDLEKDPDGQLDFLIIDTIIEYKKALEEIESDKTNQSCNDFGVMNLFHLLQSFINAGYIFSYDLKPDDMRQYIYNAHEIEFLMNHHPKKLIKEIREKKNKSVDGLINNLFKNVSFVNDKLVKKMCKMSVYTFSKVTASVDHMTQINMAQFFPEAKGIKRNFSNGVMLDENGSVGCFMVPIQKALEICKTSDSKKFDNKTLPELPKEMKWADINQECDLFFDQNKYEMLSPAEVASIFFSDIKLINGFKVPEYRFCCLNILIQRHKELFKDFLCLDKHDDENLISIYIKNCNTQSKWDLDDITAWFVFINEIFSQEQSGKKIGLNAIQQFVSLIYEMTDKLQNIISDNNKDEYIKNKAKDIILKCPINIIANLIKDNYTQSGTQQILNDHTFEDLFMAFCKIHSIKEEKDEAFENKIMFLPDKILMDEDLISVYGLDCLRVLIQKHHEDWKKFLESNSADSENLFNKILEVLIKDWEPHFNTEIDFLSFINKIIESKAEDKKIGLNALEKFMRLIFNFSCNKQWLKDARDKVINIITNITGNIYFAWNDIVKDENQENMLKSIFASAMKVLNNVYKSVNEDDTLKNQDLILWLYLICKKIYFDSDFLKTQQTNEKQLNLSKAPHFLREYKVSDGDEKISEKNIFYADDRTKEFINEIRKLGCSGLIPLVDVLPKVLEKKQEAQQKLAQQFRKYSIIDKVSKSIKSIPDELTSLALNKDDPLSVFSAVKTLYKMKRYDDLKNLLLSKDYELNIVRKLFLECQDYSEKSLIIEEFPLNDIHKSQVEGIGIVIKLLLEENMSISFYQGNSLLYEIQKLYQLARGEFETKLTNKQEIKQFFQDTWKQYFGTNENIFDVAVDIIGRITFYHAYWYMKNSVCNKDLTLDLRSMAHRINEIIMSECMSKNKEEKEKVYSNHKDLILWLYMLYTKIYFRDESLLKKEDGKLCYDKLCDYRIDDIIQQVKDQTLKINYKCIDKFLKWLSEHSCQFIQDMIDNGAVPKDTLQNIYEKICDTVNDGEAYWRLNKSKIKELILSDKPDDVMNKLFSSFSDDTFTNMINKYEKFNSILIELDKIDFKLSLYAIRVIQNFMGQRNFEDSLNQIKGFCKYGNNNNILVAEYKQPIEMLSIILTKIYFPSDDIKKYISYDEYTELLKVICAEFKYYNQERNKMIDKVPEYIYDLVGYLYLLHRAIQDNVNYFAVEQNNNDKLDTELNSLKRNMKEYLRGHLKLSNEIISSMELDKYDYRKILKPLTIAENLKTKKAANKLKEMSLKNRYYHLNKSLRQLKGKIKLKEVIKELQTKINKEKQIKTLKKWKERNELIKARKETKEKFQTGIKNQISKKCEERKNKIEAKEKIKNTAKKKYCLALADTLKQVKQRDKLKKILERRQTKINKERESHALKKWQERKNKIEAKDKIKNRLKKQYYSTLAKNLKQVKVIDLLNKGIIKKNRSNVTDSLKENDKKIKTDRFNIIKPEIQKKWKERYELIKAREETKKKFQNDIKNQIQQKWKERKNKIKQRDKLKEILEKRQTKINKEMESHALKKWQERKNKIEAKAKEKTKNMLKKKYCFTLVKNFKQFKALDLLKKGIIKKNRRNVTDSLKKAENERNKQKRSNASSKIKKIIFSAVVDLILAALAIIFLEKIILILALVVLAIIFIVCCGFAIKNGRDYKNLGTKISAFEERQRKLNINQQQQIVPNREVEQDNLIKND